MNNLFNSSIQKQFFKYFFITSILSVVALGFFAYYFYLKKLSDSEYEHLRSTTNKAKYNIEFLLSIVKNNAVLLSFNENIINACSKDFTVSSSRRADVVRMVNTMLMNSVTLNEHLHGIYIIGSNGLFFSSYWDINEEKIRKWLHLQDDTSTRNFFNGHNAQGIYLPQLDRNVISFIKPIYKFPETKIIGILIIDINYIYMREIFMYSSLNKNDNEKVLIVNSKHETLFTFPFNTNMDFLVKENPDLFLPGVHNAVMKIFGKRSFVISEPFKQSDWRIIRITFLDYLDRIVRSSFIVLVIFLSLMIGVYFFISLLLSNSIAKPIIELNTKLRMFQNGNFDVRIDSHRDDEIGQLNKTFNLMSEEINNLVRQTLHEQKRKTDLEFKALQAQINPHFLYNTLDSIKWLAVIQGVENISDMITALINLLKYNSSHLSPLVLVGEEIDSIKNYIQIQKFRYGDIFSVEYDIPEEILQLKMLKFVLQPIVENAIFHGLKDVEEDGKIIISGYKENERTLVMTVSDNGSGFQFNPEKKTMQSQKKGKRLYSGIGLSNLQERINLFFKDEYGLTFSNQKEGGGRVTIRLPLNVSEEDLLTFQL